MFLSKWIERLSVVCYDSFRVVRNMVEQNTTLCEEVNRINLKLIHFVHGKLASWWKGGTETILCSHLYYIRKGSATVICNGTTHITMSEGNWYLFPTGTAVKYWCDDFMEEFAFHFKLCNIDHTDLLFRSGGPFVLPIEEDISEKLQKLLHDESINAAITVQNIVYSQIIRFVDRHAIKLNTPTLSPCVSKALSYINCHLSMNLSVTDIAKSSFVSKSTLAKNFKAEVGVSVHEYISDAVMLKASHLLRSKDMSIHSISESLGFCDQFYFSKCFKDKFRKSPRDFRNSPTI